MIRRFTPILLLLSLLMLSLVLLTPFQAFALTTTPLPPTFTRTPTLTSTATVCALPTAVSMTVSPVVSPTSAITQVVKVNVFAASVTITSEAGSFTSTTSTGGVFSITVNLVPNSTNHLQAVATITSACRPYTLSRSTDSAGNPLNIVQMGGTPTITPTSGTNQADLSFPSTPYWMWDPGAYDSVNGCYNYVPVLVWNVQVKNTGSADASSFTVSQNYDRQKAVTGLGAGQASTLYFPFSGFPIATAAAGQPTLSASYSNFIADYNNTVSESNESNNTVRAAIPTFTRTVTPQAGATRVFCKTATPGTPISPTPSNTPTLTPVISVTRTPTVSPTPTCGCIPSCTVTSVIAAPFSFDGAGSFCWQSSNLGSYVNSWNLSSLTINGVNETNLYVPAASLPAKIGGYWYVSYSSSVAWGHFEAK